VFSWKKVKIYAKIKGFSQVNMLLDKNPEKNQLNFAKRLVFEDAGSPENLALSESQNLKNISETVKESYLQRQELREGIDNKIKDIHDEMAAHKQVVEQLHQRVLNEQPQTSISQDFICLGQTVTVSMDPSGNYEEFITVQGQQKSINFLSWAIEQKNMLNKTNASV
jgi:hypothetical protein